VTRLRLRRCIIVGLVLAAAPGVEASAQSSRPLFSGSAPDSTPAAGATPGASLAAPDGGILRPPAPIPGVPAAPAEPASLPPAPPAPPAAAPSRPAANPSGIVPLAAMGGVALSARFGREAPAIGSGLHWRVFSDRPEAGGQFRMIQEDRSASPFFKLPPGGYIVHVALGLASAAKRIQVGTDTVRETFELPVGGVRLDGRVGDTRIPNGQISFEIYRGSQFDPGDKRPVANDIPPGGLVLLPEGTYHVVSNYGDGNAVMRYDLRVAAGKLTDARINHRAAVITLKLVSERGGEALANTAWSVLTPGGDVIKESIGAFPTVVLAEGEYVVLARNEGKVFNREFKVETGFDREIELVAR
jgi:hypothetical protein